MIYNQFVLMHLDMLVLDIRNKILLCMNWNMFLLHMLYMSFPFYNILNYIGYIHLFDNHIEILFLKCLYMSLSILHILTDLLLMYMYLLDISNMICFLQVSNILLCKLSNLVILLTRNMNLLNTVYTRMPQSLRNTLLDMFDKLKLMLLLLLLSKFLLDILNTSLVLHSQHMFLLDTVYN